MTATRLLPPTAANLRAEIARAKIQVQDVASELGMHPNTLYMWLNEVRPISLKNQQRVVLEINRVLGEDVFSLPTD